MVKVKFKKLNKEAIPFRYSREDDACMDIYANENVYVFAGKTVQVKTGIAVEVPEGYEGIIRGRSGLACDAIFAHTGTIDEQYRGEVLVILTNHSPYLYEVKKGERIAQFTIKPVYKIELEEVEELSDSERGDKGFGSSGR